MYLKGIECYNLSKLYDKIFTTINEHNNEIDKEDKEEIIIRTIPLLIKSILDKDEDYHDEEDDESNIKDDDESQGI